MQLECVSPNSVTIACMLTVSARLSAGTLCKQIHCCVMHNWLEFNILIGNSLLAAYARCGYISSALYLFHKMPEKDEISWNSIISGLGTHGLIDEVFALLHEMKAAGIRPDKITFTCILSACSHTGRVTEGLQHFRSMTDEYGILPTLEHYTCMVDLLGWAGHLDQAYDLIMQIPCELDAHVWGSLLGACEMHGDKRFGELVANQIFRIDAGSAGYHVLPSNLYEDFGEWDVVARIRAGMKDIGLNKKPGCSWIEENNNAYVFLAVNKLHSCFEEIYNTLAILTGMIREEGYKPQLYTASMEYDKATEKNAEETQIAVVVIEVVVSWTRLLFIDNMIPVASNKNVIHARQECFLNLIDDEVAMATFNMATWNLQSYPDHRKENEQAG
ncbi:hypothetical protein ACLOJK_032468 [Asimina triloba]